MAIPILSALAAGKRLEDEATLDGIIAQRVDWSSTAKDVSIHTTKVLGHLPLPTTDAARSASKALHGQSMAGRA
jgi:ADP-ribosyl-[dinitrogen reductase] hydrolase